MLQEKPEDKIRSKLQAIKLEVLRKIADDVENPTESIDDLLCELDTILLYYYKDKCKEKWHDVFISVTNKR